MSFARRILSAKILKDNTGYVEYSWKKDLREEESDNYLPEGYSYSKVLELELIEAERGKGADLMRKFLNSSDAKKAELIFLDLSPDQGDYGGISSNTVMDKLERFYKQFGFRNRKKYGRMWLVNKGQIPTTKLPT